MKRTRLKLNYCKMWFGTGIFAALSLFSAFADDMAEVVFDRADRMYKTGDDVTVTVTVKDDKTGEPVKAGKYIVAAEGRRFPFDAARNNPFKLKFKPSGKPGIHGVLPVKPLQIDQKALTRWQKFWFDADKLDIAYPEPADFMQFWQARLARERQKDLGATLTELPGLEKKGVYKVYKVSMNAPLGRIYGFLSVPEKAKNGKVPAEMTTCYAGPGWTGPVWCSPDSVVLSMNIHTFDPADRDKEYGKLNAPLREKYKRRENYMFIGLPDPDKLYYIHGIIGNVLALDWLASLPEVDAKHICYFGTSQGGFFGLVLGALSDKLSAIVCDVPALCDNSSFLAGRETGFPWYPKTKEVRKAVSYIDGANFARYVKTPIRIVTSEYDDTCCPHTVRIAYNRIPPSTDKRMFTQWGGEHARVKIIYAELQRWMRTKTGKPCPENIP